MKRFNNRFHLKNVLSCIGLIENYCTDLSLDQLQDDELRMLLYRNFTIIGFEAARIDIEHPSIFTLKSFEKADFINGLGKDTYAIFSFIVNDLTYLKTSLTQLLLNSISKKGKVAMA